MLPYFICILVCSLEMLRVQYLLSCLLLHPVSLISKNNPPTTNTLDAKAGHGQSVCLCRGPVLKCKTGRRERKRVAKLCPCVYPPQVGGTNQKPGSTCPPYKVKGFGKSFCLLPAKAFGQEGRSTLLAQLTLSSWEVKTMGGKSSVCQLHGPLRLSKGKVFLDPF